MKVSISTGAEFATVHISGENGWEATCLRADGQWFINCHEERGRARYEAIARCVFNGLLDAILGEEDEGAAPD